MSLDLSHTEQSDRVNKRDSEVYVAYSASEFPMYIRLKDLVPLWTESKTTANKKRAEEFRNKCFKTWLNETTIDAIVMMSGKPRETLHGVYLGSSFNLDTLAQSSDRYVTMVQTELLKSNRVVMTLNTGSHWVLLHFEFWYPDLQDGKPPTRSCTSTTLCTLYDPMATSSLATHILVFAAKVCGRELEFEAATSTRIMSNSENASKKSLHEARKMVSVRTQLSKYNLSFFRLVNVGVQLSQKEGYNCGMYAALWARVMLHDWIAHGENANPALPKYSTFDIMQQRLQWNERLVSMIRRSQASSPHGKDSPTNSQNQPRQRNFSRLVTSPLGRDSDSKSTYSVVKPALSMSRVSSCNLHSVNVFQSDHVAPHDQSLDLAASNEFQDTSVMNLPINNAPVKNDADIVIDLVVSQPEMQAEVQMVQVARTKRKAKQVEKSDREMRSRTRKKPGVWQDFIY
jgi:hypothetical protein